MCISWRLFCFHGGTMLDDAQFSRHSIAIAVKANPFMQRLAKLMVHGDLHITVGDSRITLVVYSIKVVPDKEAPDAVEAV